MKSSDNDTQMDIFLELKAIGGGFEKKNVAIWREMAGKRVAAVIGTYNGYNDQ